MFTNFWLIASKNSIKNSSNFFASLNLQHATTFTACKLKHVRTIRSYQWQIILSFVLLIINNISEWKFDFVNLILMSEWVNESYCRVVNGHFYKFLFCQYARQANNWREKIRLEKCPTNINGIILNETLNLNVTEIDDCHWFLHNNSATDEINENLLAWTLFTKISFIRQSRE